ncbi:MAG: hypothetical protein ACRC2S_25605 [Waterburya sp.]
MTDAIIQLRSANSNDIAVIYTLIVKKSEFDRSIGAYSDMDSTDSK